MLKQTCSKTNIKILNVQKYISIHTMFINAKDNLMQSF